MIYKSEGIYIRPAVLGWDEAALNKDGQQQAGGINAQYETVRMCCQGRMEPPVSVLEGEGRTIIASGCGAGSRSVRHLS